MYHHYAGSLSWMVAEIAPTKRQHIFICLRTGDITYAAFKDFFISHMFIYLFTSTKLSQELIGNLFY